MKTDPGVLILILWALLSVIVGVPLMIVWATN
jgi:hypothetical protein